MEQNEKYYVPDLSEFHVGFEYEQWQLDDTWKKLTVDIHALYYISESLRSCEIRVKRLDHDDIVGEGWNGQSKLKLYNLGKYWLEVIAANFVEITNEDKYEDCGDYTIEKPLFQGEILNVSELRFQMKRLGIKSKP